VSQFEFGRVGLFRVLIPKMGADSMATILPPDATLPDVLATLAKAEHYVRGMLENLYECKREHGSATARIGITGGGIAPHYRIDYSGPENKFNIKNAVFGAFDGRNHKIIDWIEEAGQLDGSVLKNEHWSTRSMSIRDVAAFLGQIRNFKKAKN
jgi:hypothetical protein